MGLQPDERTEIAAGTYAQLVVAPKIPPPVPNVARCMRRHVNGPSPRWKAIVTILPLFLFLVFPYNSANAQLAAAPSAVNYGSVAVGNRSTLGVTVSNTDQSSWSISRVAVSTTNYSVSGISLPVTLAPGQSVTFSATFAPSSAGTVTDSISISAKSTTTGNKKNSRGNSKQSAGLSVALSGTGTAAAAPGQLAATPTSLTFSSIQVGTTTSQVQTIKNSGGTSVNITQAGVSSAAFSVSGVTLPATLAAGQSMSFNVTFAPTASGTSSGTLTLVSDALNPSLGVSLTGTASAPTTPGQLAASPTSMSFSTIQVGSTNTQYQTVKNSGGSSVNITAAGVSSAAFNVTGLTLPTTLAVGQSVTFGVVFAPTASGSSSGTLTLTSNASNSSLGIGLSGSASAPGALSVNPGSIDFGSVIVGQSATKSGTLTASGSSVTVSSANSTTSEFSLSGLTLPVTLSPGQSVSYNVTFKPQASGSTAANLNFVSNASTSTVAESLTGSGTAAPSHSVDLSWSASASTVAGYNLYRGTTAAGPFTKLNSVLDAGTTFTDNNVVAGSTYYYVATSVDTSGTESGYSNAVSAVVPTP
jgi:hypothetical protein